MPRDGLQHYRYRPEEAFASAFWICNVRSPKSIPQICCFRFFRRCHETFSQHMSGAREQLGSSFYTKYTLEVLDFMNSNIEKLNCSSLYKYCKYSTYMHTAINRCKECMIYDLIKLSMITVQSLKKMCVPCRKSACLCLNFWDPCTLLQECSVD